MPEKNHRNIKDSNFAVRILICICIIFVILAIYWPVYKYDFIRFDDPLYVIKNIHIHSLNWDTVKWALTTNYAGNWHPLTWLSLAVDYQLFQNRAGGYHLVNLIFHIVNSILLFYVFVRMTKTIWPSAFVAAAFAFHPLHVESVAWVSERKDLLSTLFWILTMMAYVRYVEKQNAGRYLITLLLFIFGLMAKPMLVTLSFVLLLLDYWPFERKFNKRLVLEKIPFLICSILCSVVTYYVQKVSGYVPEFQRFDLAARLKNVAVSYVLYIWKMIHPGDMAILYPFEGNKFSMIMVFGCVVLLAAFTIFAFYIGRKRKYFITGWLWYIGTLVPVIGFVQIGAQGMADRYTYMTLTGLFIIIAWSAKEFVSARNSKVVGLLAVLALVNLAASAAGQVKYWENSKILFKHSIDVTRDNYMMLDNYGGILAEEGKLDDAINYFHRSLEIYPGSAIGNNNLACAFQQAGDLPKAEYYFKRTIEINQHFIYAYLNLAENLRKQNKNDEALEVLSNLLQKDPRNITAYSKMALIYYEMRKFKEAADTLEKAIEIDPNNENLRQLLKELKAVQ